MKTTLVNLFMLVIFITNIKAQVNLVPNPSFEDTVHCPFMPGQIYYALHWSSPNGGTSDLFNTCSPINSNINVPSNQVGYQLGKTGNSYAGIYIYEFGTNLREYLQVKSDSVLLANHIYCASFYVSPQDSGKIICNNIGMYFSDTAIHCSNQLIFNVIPQIDNNSLTNPLTDKLGWTKVSGNFVASGGEQYITIGNFTNDSNCDTIHTVGHYWAPYFYIDDVSVVDCTYDGVEEMGEGGLKVKIIPNPNSGQMTLSYHLAQAAELSIYDMQGRRLHTYTLPPNNQTLNLNLEELNSGIYYYSIHTKDKQLKTEKLVIVK